MMNAAKSDKARLAALAGAVAIAVMALYYVTLGGIPHGWDAITYDFQSRVFASGRLTAPQPAVPGPFFSPFVVTAHERQFAIYTPGWPLLLAPFQWIGLRGLAGALVAAAGVVLLWDVTRRAFGNARVAWIAAGLAAISPFYLFMSASGLSHLPCVVGLLALHACLLRALKPALESGERRKWCALAGLAASFAFLCRPYSAVLGMAGTVIVVACAARASFRDWIRVVVFSLPTGLIGIAGFMLWNMATTGSPLTSGYKIYASDFSFLGTSVDFHRDSIVQNLRVNLLQYARASRKEIWGGLLPDAFLITAGILPALRRGVAIGAAAAAALFVLGYSLYFYFDLYFGPRLIFEAFPWMAMLAAAAIDGAIRLVQTARVPKVLRCALVGVVSVQLLWTLFATWPRMVKYYAANYCGQSPKIVEAVRELGVENALVLVSSNEPMLAFASLLPLNKPQVAEGGIVFARFMPGLARTLAEEYPREELVVLRAEYERLPGRNIYHDRFEMGRIAVQVLGGPEELPPAPPH